jgi:RNA polymerase sigma-70 factor (ECF subfamily)
MDEILLKRFKSGDGEAFKKIYDVYADESLRLARVIAKNDALAADAVQEAFLRAYTYRGKYNSRKPFKLWFSRIVVNECRRLMSKNKRNEKIVEFAKETTAESTHDMRNFERYEMLYNALEKLPEDGRIPLVLKYCHGYSEKEISEILNLPQSTVKARLFQARRKMRGLITSLDERGVL